MAGTGTYVNHSMTNGAPSALLIANYHNGTAGHPLKVGWSSDDNHWIIQNADNALMIVGSQFRVIVFRRL